MPKLMGILELWIYTRNYQQVPSMDYLKWNVFCSRNLVVPSFMSGLGFFVFVWLYFFLCQQQFFLSKSRLFFCWHKSHHKIHFTWKEKKADFFCLFVFFFCETSVLFAVDLSSFPIGPSQRSTMSTALAVMKAWRGFRFCFFFPWNSLTSYSKLFVPPRYCKTCRNLNVLHLFCNWEPNPLWISCVVSVYTLYVFC